MILLLISFFVFQLDASMVIDLARVEALPGEIKQIIAYHYFLNKEYVKSPILNTDVFLETDVFLDIQRKFHNCFPFCSGSVQITSEKLQLEIDIRLPVLPHEHAVKIISYSEFFNYPYLYVLVGTNLYFQCYLIGSVVGQKKFTFKRLLFSHYYGRQTDQEPSVCVHNNADSLSVSLICGKSMKFFTPGLVMPVVQYIQNELDGVLKHEYLGGGIYLVLATGNLFFAEVQQDALIAWKQTFKNEKGEEYSVDDFSVNHDEKTPVGRSRFFTFLANQKCLLVDLLEPYVVDNEKKYLGTTVLYDCPAGDVRCAEVFFSRDTVYLEKFANIARLKLDPDWKTKKMSETGRFTNCDNKENNVLSKRIYTFIYEYSLSIVCFAVMAKFFYTSKAVAFIKNSALRVAAASALSLFMHYCGGIYYAEIITPNNFLTMHGIPFSYRLKALFSIFTSALLALCHCIARR